MWPIDSPPDPPTGYRRHMPTAFLLLFAYFTPHEPDATDLIRFPPLEMAQRCRDEARKAQYLFERKLASAVPDSAEAVVYAWAAAYCFIVWDQWDDLACAHTGCLSRLVRLKGIVSSYTWRTGEMPPPCPPVPSWAFTTEETVN